MRERGARKDLENKKGLTAADLAKVDSGKKAFGISLKRVSLTMQGANKAIKAMKGGKK